VNRKRRRRKRIASPILATLLLVAAVAAATPGLFRVPVREVKIHGVFERVAKEDIEALVIPYAGWAPKARSSACWPATGNFPGVCPKSRWRLAGLASTRGAAGLCNCGTGPGFGWARNPLTAGWSGRCRR